MPSQSPLHRKLGRKGSHRMLMLRNIVSSLIEHESIETTVARAKEARRLAERMITFSKRAQDPKKKVSAERCVQSFMLNQKQTIPKLMNELSQRYLSRPGGYTRVVRLGVRRNDGGQTAILQLVDSPKDLKWAMMTQVAARATKENKPLSPISMKNLEKCVKFRENGEDEFEKAVEMLKNTHISSAQARRQRRERKEQFDEERRIAEEAGSRIFTDKEIDLWHKHNMRY